MNIKFGFEECNLYFMDIIAEIMRPVYESASQMVGMKDLKAAITYPASFSNYSLQQLIYAIELSGFTVIAMYPEPIAASYSIIHSMMQNPFETVQKFGSEFNIIVYDFGGYTFDCSAIHVHDKKYDLIDYNCEEYTGGYYLGRDIVKEANPDLSGAVLKKNIRDCMKLLSNVDHTIYLEDATIQPEVSKKHVLKYVQKTIVLLDSVLSKVNQELKTVLFFVGGMCTCPLIRQEIRNHYPHVVIKEQNTFLYDVSHGALLLGESVITAHDTKLDLERCVHRQNPLPYNIVVEIGGERKVLNRAEKRDKSDVCVIQLNINTKEVSKVRIQCYYDSPNKSGDNFIINESFNVTHEVTITFKCWMDVVNVVHIVSECSNFIYNNMYQGFAIQHIQDTMREEHKKRIDQCVAAFASNETKRKMLANAKH